MSQWRIKGYVADSDEEDDLDLDDSTPKPSETKASSLEHPEAAADSESDRSLTPKGEAIVPLGSQDELSLDSSQNRVLNGPRLRLNTTNGNSSPTPRTDTFSRQRGPHTNRSAHAANPNLPVSSDGIPIAGHPSSEIATGSPTHAHAGKSLSTQLFSDEQLTSTPGHVPQVGLPRPLTPTHENDAVDELQQDNISAFSSPLSDARSDIEPPDYLTSSPPLLPSGRHPQEQNKNGPRQLVQVVIPPREAIQFDEAIAEKIRMGRALRKRNPIQLHPYALEAVQWDRNFKSRGLKPVHVALEHQKHHEKQDRPNHGESQELDSQDRDFVADHTQLSSVRHSSPIELPSSPPNLERTTSLPAQPNPRTSLSDACMDIDDEDFEFPDLSVLLHRKHDGSVQQGFKRRKILHTFSKKGSLNRTSSVHHPPRASNAYQTQQINTLFEAPLSPPTSENLPYQNEQLRKAHRPPQLRHLPPIRLPLPSTPATSSTRKPVQVRSVDSDSDDEPPISTARHRGLQRTASVTVLSSESSSDEGDEGNSNEYGEKSLEQAKKRIKGVLPASWLRLDQQAQATRKPPSEPLHYQRPISDASPRPGIPRIISRRASPGPSTRQRNVDPIVIQDDLSESGSDSASASMPQPRQNLEADLGFVDSFDDMGAFEIQEHDWIDPMLPPAPRQSVRKKHGKKRQLKLTDTMGTRAESHRLDKSDRPLHSRGARPGKSKSKATNGQRSRRVPRSRAPELSILDAPLLNKEGTARVPQFLKIAARQARQHPNKGRHSPTNKLIRLQTEADTEDANLALRDWRASKIKPSTRNNANPQTTQPPLHKCILDVHGQYRQKRLPAPEKLQRDDGSPSRSELSGPEGGRVNTDHSMMRQMKLNPIAIPRDASPNPSSKSRKSKPKFSIAHRPPSLQPKPKQPGYRTAQLERSENEHESRDRVVAFRRKLSQLDRMYVSANKIQFRDAWTGQSRNPRLERFLQDKDEITPLPDPHPEPTVVIPSVEHEDPRPLPKPRRRLKAKVRRIDVETREFRQPSDPVPHIQERLSSPPLQTTVTEAPRLEGLGLYGTRYPMDFDVSRLWSGTFFHESTMIGSGEFQQALNSGCRDMDAPTGLSTFSHEGTVFRWGAWTEEVASEMASLLSSTASRLENAQNRTEDSSDRSLPMALIDFLCVLRNISKYFSTTLHFLDPIDRRPFVSRMQNLLDSASGSILADLANLSDNPIQDDGNQKMRLRLSVMLALLALQVTQVADQQQTFVPGKASTNSLFISLVKPALQSVLRKGMGELRSYIDENRRHTAREQGIREDRVAVETVVMVNHMLLARGTPQQSFWDLVKDEWTSSIAKCCHVQSFERFWYNVFGLLPYLEIDSSGLVKPEHCLHSTQGDWAAAVPMINRLFTLYPETVRTNGASINVYVRACLTRCYNLVHVWGWKKCDSLLTSVFDFFSRRGFNHLQNEESKGSPRFLEDLHQHPRLDVQPDDTAFHIFLRILAVGFQCLRRICTERQIQSIAWRLVPNHRRTYHKEEDLRQEDLDGLRNQHDLLCTLYWVSPPGFRPRLTSLRNLVDQTRSHREVCRLSVRAWSNLVRYQISTTEGNEPLMPFAEWFKEIISQNLIQYRLARSEAESQYEAARSSGNDNVSAEQLQLTIKNNQAQIVATLGDAVYGMKAAMATARETGTAISLLHKSAIADAFKLFDAKNTQVGRLIAEVLEVFQACLRLLRNQDNHGESQQASEDSQDYGSGFSLEDIEPTVISSTTVSLSSIDFLHDAVWQLVSSCFGADTAPDDALLIKVMETWTMIAHHLVRIGQRGWSNFLDPYHANSWRQLQDTEQTRRYTALFMAMVLDQDAHSYDENKDGIFLSWFLSLVERESTLKFQHRLTTSLINRDPGHPLLRNLPFLVDPKSSRVDIKLSEFRQRRLALISSVLSNMRDDYEGAMYAGHNDLPGLRRGYAGLIRQFMAAMKKNYLDLGQSSAIKGAYVEFVHNVVEFLQQHTHEICPVDQFFTDSSAFPLPATDPTYVVGRLKSYAPKLLEQKTLKQLVSFIQNVSERAAVDNEQAYLANQLCTATVGKPEQGDARKPTLRQVLLCGIFPAYIEQAFKTTAGWILAKPLLQASRPILEKLDYQSCQYSLSDAGSVAVVDALLSTMLDAMHGATELLITHSGLLEQPHVLHMLALVFDAVAATVLPAAHLHRRTGRARGAVQRIDAFRAFSLFVASGIIAIANANPDDEDASVNAFAFSPYPATDPDPLPEEQTTYPFAEARRLCVRNLAEAASANHWVQQEQGEGQGQFFLVRKNNNNNNNGGRTAVAIHTAVRSLDEERQRCVGAIEAFHARLRLALWEGEEDLRRKRGEGKRGRWPTGGDGEVVVI
ncbi:methyl methanesulfonate-sensitivity protein 22 [Diplodia corticola]|uniref:Methyl methanesulfonate-sensitivity protein 22 n=1 Tax=Diplodia corticola TaxID=236234 RepID=A0A1J9RWC4_9PEZI|nr:methyl methanesulfonate-sensitivity protein 22 [Diplodia corticola]OJD31781.1 methyl methanesulfonate-sensitivity protein 22 [Diplodia corticola]